ncbi:piggyBac transposable element-derived protein 4-like [Vespula squamosa]|uniref:PiggyBac transposable element-derived protein 4-like n=1 Tax=Vespula squamosa TaxID=30214 RepID=A0ABD2AFE2_VESSQ
MNKNQINSSSDEFDFSILNKQIIWIHDGLRFKTNESSGEDSDEVTSLKQRKIRIIDSESETESETAEDASSTEWALCGEYEEMPRRAQFISGKHPIEGRTLSANSIWRSWRDVENAEFWAFIVVIINMDTMPLTNLQEYWSRDNVSYIPFYPETFTRDRFNQVFWMLHLTTIPTNNTNPRSRLQQVSCFLDYINPKFLDYFIPDEQICVDESTVKFKGRISFIAYNSKKPTKWGIRIYTLADSNTGYICCILPYYGSLITELLVRFDLPVSSRIPLHLYKMLEKIPSVQGYHMYTDRYYISYVLAQELAKLKCHIIGTILTNRKELPSGIKKTKFVKTFTVSYPRNNTLLLAWKDKRPVTCLTQEWRPSEGLHEVE